MLQFLDSADDPTIVSLVRLGLEHEMQHQELLVYDIKHLLCDQFEVSLVSKPQVVSRVEGMAEVAGGLLLLGYQSGAGAPHSKGFGFDNEKPEHQVFIKDFAIDRAPVSNGEFLKGARFSMSATLPLTNNSLTSDTNGTISGGGGFADSYYQPFILGWTKKRVAIRAVYGFLAPTGHFDAGGTSNAGSGYWTHAPSSGQTWYLSDNKTTAISAFQMYEFHTTQQGTGIHPGDTFDLDYSLMQTLTPRDDMRVQVGLVGYGQWQTTDKSGPGLSPAESAAHYGVNAFGFGTNLVLPQRKVSLGFKYFKEFSNRSTFQGYSTQISGSITF
jgi:hypothetical protein